MINGSGSISRELSWGFLSDVCHRPRYSWGSRSSPRCCRSKAFSCSCNICNRIGWCPRFSWGHPLQLSYLRLYMSFIMFYHVLSSQNGLSVDFLSIFQDRLGLLTHCLPLALECFANRKSAVSALLKRRDFDQHSAMSRPNCQCSCPNVTSSFTFTRRVSTTRSVAPSNLHRNLRNVLRKVDVDVVASRILNIVRAPTWLSISLSHLIFVILKINASAPALNAMRQNSHRICNQQKCHKRAHWYLSSHSWCHMFIVFMMG